MDLVTLFLPRIAKNDVTEDLRITTSEMDTFCIPSYKKACEYFSSSKIKSQLVKDLQELFYSAFDKDNKQKKANFIMDIEERLHLVKANLEYLTKRVSEELATQTMSEGSDLKVKSCIRASEHMSFITRYSLDLLGYVYSEEATAINADVADSMYLVPAVKIHIENNILRFAFLIGKYGRAQKDFASLFSKIPKVVVTKDNAASIAALYESDEVDPLGIDIATDGFMYSPIYHVRLQIAEWQDSRYKSNKEKKKSLELKHLQLTLMRQGKNDAGLEKEIKYTQGRIDDLSIKCKEYEDDLGA